MPDQPHGSSKPSTEPPADRLFVAGSILVVVGFLATVVTLVPLFTGGEPLPVIFYVMSLLAPAGLGLILLALWRRARDRRRHLA